jgi:hypothetical protein
VLGQTVFVPTVTVNQQQQTTSEEQMKFNKWTLGLAAVGAVSLTSAVRADEAKITPLQTALSNTTISGYVDVAAQYNPGNQSTDSTQPAGTGQSAFSSSSKIDSFTLNDVDIAIDKPEDDSPWASGYHIDLNWGADAINGLGALESSESVQGINNFGVRQAYVVVRTPLGNGIDWKVGVQDDIIGYEGNTDAANPNYTRSVGYFLEPTTLVGLIGSYKINNEITVQGGIADATSGEGTLSDKTFAGAVALTAPDSWGWIKGASLNVGTLLNIDKFGQNNFYAGVTVPTPLSALKLGASYDLVSIANEGPGNSQNDSGWDVAVYGNYQATDKLAFNLRGEYFDLAGAENPYDANGKGEEITATVQYNLWANVTSRAEFRWDHSDSGAAFGDETPYVNSYILAVNLIYSF